MCFLQGFRCRGFRVSGFGLLRARAILVLKLDMQDTSNSRSCRCCTLAEIVHAQAPSAGSIRVVPLEDTAGSEFELYGWPD